MKINGTFGIDEMVALYESDSDVGRRFHTYVDRFLKNPGFDLERAKNREKVGQMGLAEIMNFSFIKSYYIYLMESSEINGTFGTNEVKISCGC